MGIVAHVPIMWEERIGVPQMFSVQWRFLMLQPSREKQASGLDWRILLTRHPSRKQVSYYEFRYSQSLLIRVYGRCFLLAEEWVYIVVGVASAFVVGMLTKEIKVPQRLNA
jgi:hypothetical protein